MMTKCPAKEATMAYYLLWLQEKIEAPTVEKSEGFSHEGIYRVLFWPGCSYLIRLPEDAVYLSFVRGFNLCLGENADRFMQLCCAELAKPIMRRGADAWGGNMRVEGPKAGVKVERIKFLLAVIEALGLINEHIKEGGYQGRFSDHNRQHLPRFFKFLEGCPR